MKKSWNKPAVAVLAVATIAGGLTPVWASGDQGEAKAEAKTKVDQQHKIVLGAEGEGYTRYELQDLLENEALFNLLLDTHAEDLYLIIDEINFEIKLTQFIERFEENWQELLAKYDGKIHVEVRFEEEEGFIKLEQEIKDGTIYIKGTVAEDVTKVVIKKPSGDRIEIVNFQDDSFSVSFPASAHDDEQYVTLEAYVDETLVETEKLKLINDEQVEEAEALIYAMGLYDQSKGEVRVNGLVSSEADQVYVRYGEERKKAKLKTVWKGAASFSATFAAQEEEGMDEVIVEVYKDGAKIDTETVDLLHVTRPDDKEDEDELKTEFDIDAAATITPRSKTVHVAGRITMKTERDEDDPEAEELKLFAIVPDGTRHQIELDKDYSFEADLSYHNRSYSAKSVFLQLYSGGKLVAEAEIPHGKPVNHPGPAKPVQLNGHGKIVVDVKRDAESKENGKPDKKHGKWHVKTEDDLSPKWKNNEDDDDNDDDDGDDD
ncbi:MAG: hypothetical protein H0Z34_00710 [Brevibacillus sp.]|nr:hypothetical protein [Brevibacillus sp.]